MSETLFECANCYIKKELTPDELLKRHEETVVHNEDGIFKAVICQRCGSVLEPYLGEVEADD